MLENNGIHQIKSLKQGDKFLTFQQFNTLHKTNLNFLQYMSIVNSVKNYCLKFKLIQTSNIVENHPVQDLILKNKKGFSKIYHSVTAKEEEATGCVRWKKHTNISNLEWQKLFNGPILLDQHASLWW